MGKPPDVASDSTVTSKTYVDATNTAVAVTTAIVNTKIATAAATLTIASYVDTADAALAQKSAVTAADAAYVAATLAGAANGVATLDGSGNLAAAQVPAGVKTDRVMDCYSVGTTAPNQGVLGGVINTNAKAIGSVLITASHTVTSVTLREFKLASIVIPDPGYPWRPLPFAWVAGNSLGGTTPADRQHGNSSFGLLSVMPPSGVSDTVYGVGLCTASIRTDYYPVLPYAAAGSTPTSVPAITGSLELDLYGCCNSTSSTYTFLPDNLTFFVFVAPGLP